MAMSLQRDANEEVHSRVERQSKSKAFVRTAQETESKSI